MKVLGLVFLGTRTPRAAETAAFARDVLELVPRTVAGSDAVFFDLPDGATLAVQPAEPDAAGRTVGLLVDDVEAAVDELRAAGVEADDVVRSGPYRYAHFRAPDGALYELVQRLPTGGAHAP